MHVAPRALALALLPALASACDDELPQVEPSECGPSHAVVARVVDGDTVELDSGEKVRYLMIDTPESTQGKNDCFGHEAADFNRELVEGQAIALEYDKLCEDTYGRLLAYVHTTDGEINRILVRRGYACVYSLPPNGQAREAEFLALEREAQVLGEGLWGSCAVPTCQH
ncbi:MAG TPA: thermonuclease family protein [Nannocystaceae bacterium]|nr:thermonuclease family protein [Nannocystaceae bacterium]